MKAQPPRESTVAANILKYLKGLPDCYAFKTHGNGYQQGQPDILGALKGKPLAFEVKRPGGTYGVTKLQQVTLGKWKAAGAIVGVVHSVDEVKEILAQFSL